VLAFALVRHHMGRQAQERIDIPIRHCVGQGMGLFRRAPDVQAEPFQVGEVLLDFAPATEPL
jgi:hypothetical protein